jgi:hypothetical protein
MKILRLIESYYTIESDTVDSWTEATREPEVTDYTVGVGEDVDPEVGGFIALALTAAQWVVQKGCWSDGGTGWFYDPDGSYTVDYSTGEECETSIHFEGDWTALERSMVDAAVNAIQRHIRRSTVTRLFEGKHAVINAWYEPTLAA